MEKQQQHQQQQENRKQQREVRSALEAVDLRILHSRLQLLQNQRDLCALRCHRFTEMLETAIATGPSSMAASPKATRTHLGGWRPPSASSAASITSSSSDDDDDVLSSPLYRSAWPDTADAEQRSNDNYADEHNATLRIRRARRLRLARRGACSSIDDLLQHHRDSGNRLIYSGSLDGDVGRPHHHHDAPHLDLPLTGLYRTFTHTGSTTGRRVMQSGAETLLRSSRSESRLFPTPPPPSTSLLHCDHLSPSYEQNQRQQQQGQRQQQQQQRRQSMRRRRATYVERERSSALYDQDAIVHRSLTSSPLV